MTQDELFELAEKAGLGFVRYSGEKNIEKMEAFAKLVAQHEREACWNDISIALLGSDRELTKRVFKAIRARGQA